MSQSRRLQILFFAVLILGLSDFVHADELVREDDCRQGQSKSDCGGGARGGGETIVGGAVINKGGNSGPRPRTTVTHEEFVGGYREERGTHIAPPPQGCLPNQDPNSLACQQAIFLGSQYPVLDNVEMRIRGSWRPMFFNSVNASWDFRTIYDPNVQFSSLGVLNQEDGSRLGDMILDGPATRFLNWRVQRNAIGVIFGSVQSLDTHTYEFRLADFNAEQGFQCRIYLVQNAEQLICRWFENRDGSFVLRGFFGFNRSAPVIPRDSKRAITPQPLPGW